MLVYSGTGNADGTDGDTILLGPPFIVTDDELRQIATVLAKAIDAATSAAAVARPAANPPRQAEGAGSTAVGASGVGPASRAPSPRRHGPGRTR